jgi:hypothetical protein
MKKHNIINGNLLKERDTTAIPHIKSFGQAFSKA